MLRVRHHLRRAVKALHTLAAIGVGGGLAACLVLAAMASQQLTPADFAMSRRAIAGIAKLLLVPSLAVVLITGLLAIALTRGFHDAGWAWLKALLGISAFEGVLVTVGASSRAAEWSALVADPAQAAALASLLRSEWNTLLLLTGLSVANVVLGVWRPKLSRAWS